MSTAGLAAALQNGEPLADFVVKFREGVDAVALTEIINSLADDFHLLPRPWYDDPLLRIGTATKAALERMFDWKLKRSALPGRTDDEIYWWEQITPPTRFPAEMEGTVESIGLTQPGADDDGQWYDYQ